MKTLWDLLGVGKGRDEREARRAEAARAQREGAAVGEAPAPEVDVAPKPAARRRRPEPEPAPAVEPATNGAAHPPAAGAPPARRPRPARASMAERYEALTRQMLREHDVRVRKWRSSMSGCAWEVYYASGRVSRLIESPKPKGPMSCAIFLHEIGHHAIGFGRYRPRCLEEYHAWRFAIEQMELHGVKVTDGVRKRMDESMRYAVDKAKRRGLRQLPAELERWGGGGMMKYER